MTGWGWRAWRRRRLLRRARIDDALWDVAQRQLPALSGLNAAELARLRELVLIFLHEKNFQPGAGLVLDEAMRLHIALLACLLILNLDLDYYDPWVDIVLYPGEFAPRREYVDAAGVVHVVRQELAGEAWPQGPVILSWADAQMSVVNDGANVVIHEFAHKLDMLNGDANGFPPLHKAMDARQWQRVCSAAYEDLCAREDAGESLPLDPYACENPGEFFAVVSEAFFETPNHLKRCYPELYEQFAAFYRQHPAVRLAT